MPDSGKPAFEFETAVQCLEYGLAAIRASHRPRGFVLGGDFNAELVKSRDEESEILGDIFYPCRHPGRFSERQELLMSMCSRFGLVHGPSRVTGDPL